MNGPKQDSGQVPDGNGFGLKGFVEGGTYLCMTKGLIFLMFVIVYAPYGAVIAAELPLDIFFKSYDTDQVELSPDGKCLAMLVPYKDVVGIGVMDLATGTVKR